MFEHVQEEQPSRLLGHGTFLGGNEMCCCNPSLALATKARPCKGEGQERNPGVAFHAPGSVGEFEGMNLHIPKGPLTLGVGVLNL